MPRLRFRECERLIGHCWEESLVEEPEESCRHCGAVRRRGWTIQHLPSPPTNSQLEEEANAPGRPSG